MSETRTGRAGAYVTVHVRLICDEVSARQGRYREVIERETTIVPFVTLVSGVGLAFASWVIPHNIGGPPPLLLLGGALTAGSIGYIVLVPPGERERFVIAYEPPSHRFRACEPSTLPPVARLLFADGTSVRGKRTADGYEFHLRTDDPRSREHATFVLGNGSMQLPRRKR